MSSWPKFSSAAVSHNRGAPPKALIPVYWASGHISALGLCPCGAPDPTQPVNSSHSEPLSGKMTQAVRPQKPPGRCPQLLRKRGAPSAGQPARGARPGLRPRQALPLTAKSAGGIYGCRGLRVYKIYLLTRTKSLLSASPRDKASEFPGSRFSYSPHSKVLKIGQLFATSLAPISTQDF